MKVKTSIECPIYINWIPVINGKLGITFCPGKNCPSVIDNIYWQRDLNLDLSIFVKESVNLVITLIEEHEMIKLNVTNLGEKIKEYNMDWIWLPIRDNSIPNEQFIKNYKLIFGKIKHLLQKGGNIVVHCRGGLGRAGTVVCMILIDLKIDLENINVINYVRRYRPCAVESYEQEKFVNNYK